MLITENKQPKSLCLMNSKLNKPIFYFLVIASVLSCEKELNIGSNEQAILLPDKYFVSLEEAESIVAQLEFEKSKGDISGKEIGDQKTIKKIKGSKSFLDINGIAAGHIINFEEGGFVIISADKRTEALMAYSNENEFSTNLDSVPPGPRGWLLMASNYISDLRSKVSYNDSLDFRYSNSWQISELENVMADRKSLDFSGKLETSAIECYYPGYPPGCTSICQDTYYTKGPLLQTEWGQEDGFNNYLPFKSCTTTFNGRSLTGCVTIAMAQVMRYHQEPSSRYNFSAMPLGSVGSNETSRLVRDIGNSLNVNYGCNATWVNPGVIDGGFGLFFYTDVVYEDYDNYDYTTIKLDLNRNLPVLLEGKEKPLISFDFSHLWHVWVCDGYKTRYDCQNGIGYLYFHMNWGWLGKYNGWFGVNDWNPNGIDLKYYRHYAHNIQP